MEKEGRLSGFSEIQHTHSDSEMELDRDGKFSPFLPNISYIS
jgi:hypothetical protein